jgi:hypothetical protein
VCRGLKKYFVTGFRRETTTFSMYSAANLSDLQLAGFAPTKFQHTNMGTLVIKTAEHLGI